MNEIILQLRDLYNQIIDLTKSTEFDSNNEQQLCAACLQGTILEQTSAFIILMENQQWNTLPLVFRSLFEAYVHLVCIDKDPEYIKHMHASDLKEKKKIRENARNHGDTNPYLEGISQLPDNIGTILELENELGELKKEGIVPWRISKRFEEAGLKNEYYSVYAELCQHTHHNMKVLKNRHFAISNNEIQYLTFHKYSASYIGYIGTISHFIINSFEIISHLLELSNQPNIDKLRKDQSDILNKLENFSYPDDIKSD